MKLACFAPELRLLYRSRRYLPVQVCDLTGSRRYGRFRQRRDVDNQRRALPYACIGVPRSMESSNDSLSAEMVTPAESCMARCCLSTCIR